MKNINYNLVKLLLSEMDNAWRLENYYIKDAEKAGCRSIKVLKEILANEQKHIAMLRKEIVMRCGAEVFD